MEWNELPKRVLENMEWLGNFGPTTNVEDKLIKGYMYDDDGGGKCYLSSKELRELSEDLLIIAIFLEQRAPGAH